MTTFTAPKGTFDILPPRSGGVPRRPRRARRGRAQAAGYGYIETPVFEDTALFARGVGESTDVVTQGDVHLRRQRRPLADPAPRGHRRRAAGGPRARPAQRPAAGEALVRRAGRSATSGRRPAATASSRRSASRRSASTTRRWTPRSIALAVRGLTATSGLTEVRLLLNSPRRRRVPAGLPGRAAGRSCAGSTSTRTPARRVEINPLRVLDDKRPEVQAQLGRRAAGDRPPVRGLQGPPRRGPRAT